MGCSSAFAYLEDDVPDVSHDLGARGEEGDGPRGQVADTILLSVSGLHDVWPSSMITWIVLSQWRRLRYDARGVRNTAGCDGGVCPRDWAIG